MSNNTRILRLAETLHRCGLSRSSVYALAAQNKFPRPIKLSVRASGFEEAAVDRWVRERIKQAQKAESSQPTSPTGSSPEKLP